MNTQTYSEAEPGPPHEALYLILAYLPVYELLNISEVCKSFRDTVNNDVWPWLNIILDRPLSSRSSDEILLKITSKANGRLRTLVLRNCLKITDHGLRRVIEKNLCISKLHLPGCTGLTPHGIIRAVEILYRHQRSLTSLQINGIYNLKKQHLEILSSYLPINPAKHKPQQTLYNHYRTSPSPANSESDQAIDVDICPMCNEVRIVFDCSRKGCRQKMGIDCRGCSFCIPRCEECGGCMDAEEQEDTACADIMCSRCWLRLPKCNYCNKPYCKLHSNKQLSCSGNPGFVCEACHASSSEFQED